LAFIPILRDIFGFLLTCFPNFQENFFISSFLNSMALASLLMKAVTLDTRGRLQSATMSLSTEVAVSIPH
jgi:hypothetical protein